MRILMACEESQTICKAFRELGHEAFSCDIQPCSGGHPEWHIQDDVLKHLDNGWDLMIAHPPCTYLSHAGARWLYPKKGEGINKERYAKGLEAKDFFIKLLNADIPMIAVENPFPSPVYNMPEHTQIIQPFEFGHPIQKKTFLWLKNLPKLKPTKVVDCEWYYDRKGIRHTKLNGWSAKRKSKTFDGIACAMAEQWHKPKVEGSPRLEETSERRTSIPPTNELAGILEVILGKRMIKNIKLKVETDNENQYVLHKLLDVNKGCRWIVRVSNGYDDWSFQYGAGRAVCLQWKGFRHLVIDEDGDLILCMHEEYYDTRNEKEITFDEFKQMVKPKDIIEVDGVKYKRVEEKE